MIKFKLLNKAEAVDYIAQPDLYTDSLTPYYMSKIMNGETSKELFIKNFQDSCGSFNQKSEERIVEYEDKFNKKLSNLKMDIDETIYLILTNGKDNISLPYTKGKAIIIPNLSQFGFNTGSNHFYNELLTYPLTIHETFHVLSRNNTKLRKDCYQSLGWIDAGKPLIPDNIIERVFTNPDAVSHDHYLTYEDNDGNVLNIAPIMYQSMGNNNFAVLDDDLNFIKILPFNQFPKYSLLWKNTTYNNHPEELSAEHFRLLISSSHYRDIEMIRKFYSALYRNYAINKNVL